MADICEGLRALGGKLNHLGLEKAAAKSTVCDGMRNRDNRLVQQGTRLNSFCLIAGIKTGSKKPI